MHALPIQVKTCDELRDAPPEYRNAVRKIVVSHALNELYGAQVFDEVAVALAPTPRYKWLTCRIAMEEYGHHVRFFELGRQMGIAEDDMLPHKTKKRPLSLFDFPLATWEEFCAIKLVGDLGEIVQVEDLLECTFHPLRALARITMPEERFHAQFGEDACAELCATPEGKTRVQRAVEAVFPAMPAFFGRPKSANNALFRKWSIKQRTNEEMRTDYIERARAVVEGKLGLRLPRVPDAA